MTYFRAIVPVAGFLLAATLAAGAPAAFAAQPLNAGQPAPAFTYNLLDGHKLRPSELRGHPYVLWMVASWCPSCQTGSNVIASHIDFLRSHGVRIVEMQLAKDLGAPGPGLQKFQKAVGLKAASPNWYWGELTDAQTAALNPKGDLDMYYLVDARGTIVAINGNPAATWEAIERFAATTPKTTSQRARIPAVAISTVGPVPNGLIGSLTIAFDPSRVTARESAAAAKAGLESDPHGRVPVSVVFRGNA